MSLVYFISSSGDSILALDCEESLNISQQNQVSEASVMSGATVSDGYKIGNKVVAVSGRVTYNKSATQQQAGNLDPIKFQEELERTVNSHTRFRLYTDKARTPLLRDIENCVISGFDISVAGHTDTILVSLAIKEVFVSDAATITYLAPRRSKEASKSTSESEIGKGKKEVVEEEEKSTMFRNFHLTGSFSGD